MQKFDVRKFILSRFDANQLSCDIKHSRKMKKVTCIGCYIMLPLLESYMYRMLQMLLEDPVPGVRSQAVLGVFRIMSLFWELMPSVTIKNIITKVIQDLAFDSSSADVRESVIKVRGQHM